MEFELKKVKCYPAFSEETEAFTAQLWENGEHIADIKNDGQGGSHIIYPVKPFTNKDVDKYNNIDMECTISERVIEMDETRKNQTKGFYLKSKDNNYYLSKFPKPLSTLKGSAGYCGWLTQTLANLREQGFTVLNNNL